MFHDNYALNILSMILFRINLTDLSALILSDEAQCSPVETCLRQFSKINRDTLPHSDALRVCIDVHRKVFFLFHKVNLETLKKKLLKLKCCERRKEEVKDLLAR